MTQLRSLKPPSLEGGQDARHVAFGHHLGALPKTSPFVTRTEEVRVALLGASPPDLGQKAVEGQTGKSTLRPSVREASARC
jgi:hypothetical protein